MVETGELISDGYVYAQRLILRLEIEFGASAIASFSYNGGKFVQAGYFSAYRKKPVEIPLRMRRSDSVRLRIEGKGRCTIHSISLYLVKGGKHAKS